MRFVFMIVCLWVSVVSIGQVRETLFIDPIDFSDDVALMPSGVGQLVVDQDVIYTRYMKDAYVGVLDQTGQVMQTIGRSGGGPGELGKGVIAMAARNGHLWVVSRNRRDYVQHFHQGEYVGELNLNSEPVSIVSTTSNRFDLSEKVLVYPAHPRDGYLAYAYSLDGEQKPQPIGELLFDHKSRDVLMINPAINDTLWAFDGTHWYGVFRFFPLIQVYDTSFNLVQSIDLMPIAQIEERYEHIMEEMENSRMRGRVFSYLFSDFSVQGDSIWLMSLKTMYRINKKTQKLTHLYQFRFGPDINAEYREAAGDRSVNLMWFTLTENGRMFLSGGNRWGHDLLKAEIKFSE